MINGGTYKATWEKIMNRNPKARLRRGADSKARRARPIAITFLLLQLLTLLFMCASLLEYVRKDVHFCSFLMIFSVSVSVGSEGREGEGGERERERESDEKKNEEKKRLPATRRRIRMYLPRPTTKATIAIFYLNISSTEPHF